MVGGGPRLWRPALKEAPGALLTFPCAATVREVDSGALGLGKSMLPSCSEARYQGHATFGSHDQRQVVCVTAWLIFYGKLVTHLATQELYLVTSLCSSLTGHMGSLSFGLGFETGF